MSSDYVNLIHAIQGNAGWLNILRSFARFVAPPAGAVLLDLGTGGGTLVEIFQAEWSVSAIGLDYNPAMLMLVDSVNPYVAGDVYALPFPDASFDMITATNVIYLLGNPVAALHEVARVLKPSGAFAMLNPSPQMTVAAAIALAEERELPAEARDHLVNWAQIAQSNPRWSVEGVQALLDKAGLQLLESKERIGAGLALYIKANLGVH